MREPTVSESIRINASPEVVYDLVADVARMGEWSPEATGARISKPGPTRKVGDTFTGTNKHGLARWSTQCTVTQAKRGEEFEFTVEFKPFKISTWRYEFAADGDAIARAIVVEPDGKIVVVGSAEYDWVSGDVDMIAVRYTTAGQLDTAFAQGSAARNGIATVDFDLADQRQPDTQAAFGAVDPGFRPQCAGPGR